MRQDAISLEFFNLSSLLVWHFQKKHLKSRKRQNELMPHACMQPKGGRNVLKQVEVVELSRGQNDKTDLTEHIRPARRNELN